MSTYPHSDIELNNFPAPTLSSSNHEKPVGTVDIQPSDSQDIDHENGPAPWRALLYFTTTPNIPIFSVGILVSIIAGAVSPAQSYVIGRIFDGFIGYTVKRFEKDVFHTEQISLVTYLVVIGAASWIFHFLEYTLWIAFGELQAKSARDRLFQGLLKKDTEWYDRRKNGIGALLPRMQAQIQDLQLATSQPLGTFVALLSTTILSLIQSFVLSWKLTLVTLASAPFIMAFVVWLGNGMSRSMEKQSEKLSEAQKFSTNAFSAIDTVKCFNAQRVELQKYQSKVQEASKWYYKVANRNAVQMGSVAFLMIAMFVQGFYYGGVLIREGELTSAKVVTCLLSAIGAFAAMQSILPQMIVFEKGRTAGMLLRAVMANGADQGKIETSLQAFRPHVCHGNIEVKNVSFAYPSQPTQLALVNASMFIPSGKMTFLIGKSGSGKSTLGQLLLRLYKVSKGGISIDGCPLETLDLQWLRANVTLVEQTSLLFNDTIFNNIALGRGDCSTATKAEVVRAVDFGLLRLATNDMPNGLDTVITGKGSSVSGGQAQRLAIARAHLRDTPIVILDESTSALDQISRTLLMDAVREWRYGKTTIIITHDVAQILPDDHVIVLEHGKVVQDGARRDMEALADAPFQHLLPNAPQARPKSSEVSSVKSTSCTESFDTSTSRKEWHAIKVTAGDSIEDRLLAAESHRRSMLTQPVYQQRSPLVSIGAVGNPLGRPAFSSPFFKTSIMLPPNLHEQRSYTVTPGLEIDQYGSLEDDPLEDMILTENIVHMAGQTAIESRTPHVKQARKPHYNDSTTEIPSLSIRNMFKGFGLREHGQAVGIEPFLNRTPKTLWAIMSTFWPSLNWYEKIVALVGIWGCTVHAAVTPLFSFLFSKLISTYATPKKSSGDALIYAMILLAIAVIDAIHVWCYRMCLEYTGQCWVDAMRCQAMERILDQPREFFDQEENSISRMTDSLDRNAEEMRNLPGRFMGMTYCAMIMILISVGWALAVQWKMTLIALAVAPYVWAVTRAFAAISEKWEARSNDAAENTSEIVHEVFTSIKTVRALSLERHFLAKYIASTESALRVGFKRSFLTGFFYGMSDSAGLFCVALIFFIGIKVAQDGTNVADVIQVFTMLMFAVANVEAILDFMPQIGLAKDTGYRMMRLARLPRDSHEYMGNVEVMSIGDIRFNDLNFSYASRPGVTVLSGIDLLIPAGTCTAIVGGSGSGKSTIAHLMLKLYATSNNNRLSCERRGDLLLGDRNIKTISTPSLRSLVTVVPQKPVVFAGTIADNITYGLSPGSQHNNTRSIQQAARLAGVHDFVISLPLGYDTNIGDGGAGLSGGQLQRLAIARALVRQPAVLILDEATSALDPESASLIRHTIQRLVDEQSRSLTVVMITHHREMMEIAGKVVVLDHGGITEEGTLVELLQRNGALANLLRGGEWSDGA